MRLPEYDEISGTFDTGQRLGKQKKSWQNKHCVIRTSCWMWLFTLRCVSHAVLICILRKASEQNGMCALCCQLSKSFPLVNEREGNATVALGSAVCTFVTISEKCGIVYTEHMQVAAAAVVMEARQKSAATKTR